MAYMVAKPAPKPRLRETLICARPRTFKLIGRRSSLVGHNSERALTHWPANHRSMLRVLTVQLHRQYPTGPVFDHGAALRVPTPGEVRQWRHLETWLGDRAIAEIEVGMIRVFTPAGEKIAHTGDWIVLSTRGELHVARADPDAWDA